MVTVVMPAYNAERYIAEAIESVLAQTYRDFEFVIVDDGSTDRTRQIAETFAAQDPRIRVVSRPNQGLCATLNLGVSLARCEWIVMMHADDVMLLNRIERQLAFVAKHPGLAVASAFVHIINADGKIIGRTISDLTTPEALQAVLRRNDLFSFSHPAVIMRKSIVQEAGGYREQCFLVEDADLWNRIAERGHPVLVQPEYLLYYRRHSATLSVSKARDLRLKARYVKECARRRRRGDPELNWDEFLGHQARRPWSQKLNEERKDLAKSLYTLASNYYAGGQYHRLILAVLGAVCLQPVHVVKQIATKLRWGTRE